MYEPEYSIKGFFTVKLYRPIRFSKWLSNLEIEISQNQEKILSAINDNNKVTYKELETIAGLGKTAIETNIRKIKDLNILERIGNKKTDTGKLIQEFNTNGVKEG